MPLLDDNKELRFLNPPIYKLQGKNYWRYFFIFLMIGIFGFTIYFIQFVGYIVLFATFSTLFFIVNIQFPALLVYNDSFVIEKKSLLKYFSKKDILEYQKIKSIRFSKSYTNWTQLIVQTILGSGGMGGFSKSDQMIITFKDGSKKIFNRFGSRENFQKAITLINERIT